MPEEARNGEEREEGEREEDRQPDRQRVADRGCHVTCRDMQHAGLVYILLDYSIQGRALIYSTPLSSLLLYSSNVAY